MGKASRNKKQRTEKVARTPKQPTTQYRTAKEKQELRRVGRAIDQRSQDLIARLAASVRRDQADR